MCVSASAAADVDLLILIQSVKDKVLSSFKHGKKITRPIFHKSIKTMRVFILILFRNIPLYIIRPKKKYNKLRDLID